MTVIESLETHPFVGLIITIVNLVVAETLSLLQIPTIVMQLFQIGAWSATIIIGSITIHGFIKKRKESKKDSTKP